MVDRSVARIAANDFARQWQDIGDDALAAVDRVGRSGWLVLGDEVRAFEEELASWWGVSFAVGVASGLDALEISLRCADIPAGARVLTTPLTAFATTLAIIRAGAEPVWCDVDDSGGLDLNQAEMVLREDASIRAVLPVHLYGHPLDLAGLRRLAIDCDVVVIEDCAQSAGAEFDGQPTGTVGVAAGTSLYPTKNLGAMGDAGVLLTNDPALADRARCLRDYGQHGHYDHAELGLNSRLDELHAAVLRTAFLPRLDDYLARRRKIASRYTEQLADSRLRLIEPVTGRSAHHLFPIEVDDSVAVADRLRRAGIHIGRHYPFLCPDQSAVNGFGVTVGSLPIARKLAERELSLPLHPYLEDDEVETVVAACLEVCR